MRYTDDPISDFLDYDDERSRKLDRLPLCGCCEEPIQQEMAVCIDGTYYCDDCLNELRVWIGD